MVLEKEGMLSIRGKTVAASWETGQLRVLFLIWAGPEWRTGLSGAED